MERSYDESSIYLQWLFLMGGWEESWWWLSRVGGDPYALTVCPVLVSRKCGGCGRPRVGPLPDTDQLCDSPPGKRLVVTTT